MPLACRVLKILFQKIKILFKMQRTFIIYLISDNPFLLAAAAACFLHAARRLMIIVGRAIYDG
jgi:hypothetical protein